MCLPTQCEQWRSRIMVNFFCVCLCLHSLLGPTFECHLFSLRSASRFSSQKFLYLPKQVQTGKGTMYLPLTQFSLRSASTFPKRDQKGKGTMYLLSQCDQWRSRMMVSFSCVCRCLHSLWVPTFECHLFSLKIASAMFISKVPLPSLSKRRPNKQRNHVSSSNSISS